MKSGWSCFCRRYGAKVAELRAIFSEFGLIRYRTFVECRWLRHLSAMPEIVEVEAFGPDAIKVLDRLENNFTIEDAQMVCYAF